VIKYICNVQYLISLVILGGSFPCMSMTDLLSDYLEQDLKDAKAELLELEFPPQGSINSTETHEIFGETAQQAFANEREQGYFLLSPDRLRQTHEYILEKDKKLPKGLAIEDVALGSSIYLDNPVLENMLQRAQPEQNFLDVGCSYGANTFKLLDKGVNVIANDMDAPSLAILAARAKKQKFPQGVKLHLSLAKFPEDLHIPEASLDGILISYVMHYMTPLEIKNTFIECKRLLKLRGKIYITVLTPYAKMFIWFTANAITQFIKKKNLWPGEINDRKNLWKEMMNKPPEQMPSPSLPNYIHPQFPEILAREASSASFNVEQALYFHFFASNNYFEDYEHFNHIFHSSPKTSSHFRYFKDAAGLIATKTEGSANQSDMSPTQLFEQFSIHKAYLLREMMLFIRGAIEHGKHQFLKSILEKYFIEYLDENAQKIVRMKVFLHIAYYIDYKTLNQRELLQVLFEALEKNNYSVPNFLNSAQTQSKTGLLHEAANKEVAEWLIGLGAEVNPAKGNLPPLHRYVQRDDRELVRFLIGKMAQVEAIFDGMTAIHDAISKEMVDILCQNGANIYADTINPLRTTLNSLTNCWAKQDAINIAHQI
jgi:SAM-dependent methyltransferase